MERTIRVFISSTFKDFAAERDLLVRKVFPNLRMRLQSKRINLYEIDLRWGITDEEAKRGEVLSICLSEVDRCKPIFIGLIGDYYGWIPPSFVYTSDTLTQHAWLHPFIGRCSITELEIRRALMNFEEGKDHLFFYFRTAAMTSETGQASDMGGESYKIRDLKKLIRQTGHPVRDELRHPDDFAQMIEEDLFVLLNSKFTDAKFESTIGKENSLHDDYALARRNVYFRNDGCIEALNEKISRECQYIRIEGPSGSGKGALLANWQTDYKGSNPKDFIFSHFVGASSRSASIVSFMERMTDSIKNETGFLEVVPSRTVDLFKDFSRWLRRISSFSVERKFRVIIVIDGIDQIEDISDFAWFPHCAVPNIYFILSCRPHSFPSSLYKRVPWEVIVVDQLNELTSLQVLEGYLNLFKKKLSMNIKNRVCQHHLANSPLFLKTLADELRLFGLHESLNDQVEYYLSSESLDDLFEKVFARLEIDCGQEEVNRVLIGIWASGAGLSEAEICSYASVKPAAFALIMFVLGSSLIERDGKISFSNSFVRKAVEDRYLSSRVKVSMSPEEVIEGVEAKRNACLGLAHWFISNGIDFRYSEEVPHLLIRSGHFHDLADILTDRKTFNFYYNRVSKGTLLELWTEVEKGSGIKIEESYRNVWPQWISDLDSLSYCSLARDLSSFLFYAGLYNEFVEQVILDGLRASKAIEDNQRCIVASLRNNLGSLLLKQSRYEEAKNLFNSALRTCEQNLGENHYFTGCCAVDLGSLFQKMGNYMESEQFFRRGLSIAERWQNKSHELEGICLNNLACLYIENGKLEAADSIFRRISYSFGIFESSNPLMSPAKLNNYAVLKHHRNEFYVAEKSYLDAIMMSRNGRHLVHPELGTFYNNLAKLYKDMGRFDEAIKIYIESIRILEAKYGADHHATIVAYNNLGVALRKRKSYKCAREVFGIVLNKAERRLGSDHLICYVIFNNLACVLLSMREIDEAKKIFKKATGILWKKPIFNTRIAELIRSNERRFF